MMKHTAALLVALLVGSTNCTDECQDGEEDCSCRADDSCQAGLVCVLGVCLEPGDGMCGDKRVNNGEECDGNLVANGLCAETCRIECLVGFSDCNHSPGDGCEADITASLAHCGGCQTPCSEVGGVASCALGNCLITCDTEHADCNGDVGDGCEVTLASDPEHCGLCDHSCLGADCLNAACLPLRLADDPAPQDLQLDDTYLYFTSLGTEAQGYNDGAVVRLDKLGLGRVTLAAPEKAPGQLALDSFSVYWAHVGASPTYNDGSIVAVDKSGGATRTLAQAQHFPGGIAAAAEEVYWTTGGATGSVAKVAKSGGNVVVVAAAQNAPHDVAIDDDHVYWTTRFGGALQAAASDGSSPMTLASAQAGPTVLALDDLWVYWVNGDEGRLLRVPKSGGDISEVADETAQITAVFLATDSIYWGLDRGAGGGEIRRVLKAGGEIESVVAGIAPPLAIGVDDVALFWVSDAGVFRLAR